MMVWSFWWNWGKAGAFSLLHAASWKAWNIRMAAATADADEGAAVENGARLT